MKDYVVDEEVTKEEEINLAFMVSADPVSFEEAERSSKWKATMDAEMNSIERNHTWQLVELPEGAKKIGVRWIYKTKLNDQGKVDKYKARLVVKWYSQQYGVNYTEVFAPVARMDTVRLIIALGSK